MEAEIKFEKENISGIAVVGSYLIDAAHRLGVYITDEESGRLALDDSTSVTVKSGGEFLSAPTKAEREVLSDERRAGGERLACQAKIEKEGEIVIVTKDKAEAPEVDKNEEYRQEFAELPLEKKVSNLLELEMMTFGETFSFILNSPYKIVGKLMDVMAEFGLKSEAEAKTSATPEEHRTADAETAGNGKKSKKKSKSKTEDVPVDSVEINQDGA